MNSLLFLSSHSRMFHYLMSHQVSAMHLHCCIMRWSSLTQVIVRLSFTWPRPYLQSWQWHHQMNQRHSSAVISADLKGLEKLADSWVLSRDEYWGVTSNLICSAIPVTRSTILRDTYNIKHHNMGSSKPLKNIAIATRYKHFRGSCS